MKTHKNITNPFLRHCYASELSQARKVRKMFSRDDFSNILFGLESGIWAVQKGYATWL